MYELFATMRVEVLNGEDFTTIIIEHKIFNDYDDCLIEKLCLENKGCDVTIIKY